MKVINNQLIRSFEPCYDPSTKGIPDNETLPVKEWVEKHRSIVPPQDILWLLLRREFYSDRQLMIFAVWCAREALKLVVSPDPRSVEACNVAERYANGDATYEELSEAWDAALTASWHAKGAVRSAACDAAKDACKHAHADWYAAHATRGAAKHAVKAAIAAAVWDWMNAAKVDDAARATREDQLNYLLTL